MRRLLADRRGAAAVELALVLPVLVLILLGAIDFGRFGHSAITVANAARTGAAYCDYAGCNTPLSAETITAVKARVLNEVCSPPTCDIATKVVITVSTLDAVGRPHCPCLVVKVQYPFTTLIPWPGIPASFTTGHEALIPNGIQS